MERMIITAAITGAIHTPSMSPYLPLTPEQIIDECIASHAAGAAVAHIHVRDPLTGRPTADQDGLQADRHRSQEKVRRHPVLHDRRRAGRTRGEKRSCGGQSQARACFVKRRFIKFCPFPCGIKGREMGFRLGESYLEGTEDFIFPNTFRTMREFLGLMDASNTKPEFEIYDVGMINNLAYLHQ